MPTSSQLLVERCNNIVGAPPRARPARAEDKAVQKLISELVAARVRIGFTQTQVAELMWTTKSAVSRLESGRGTRPTFSTVEKYALAVGCLVEIRLRPLW